MKNNSLDRDNLVDEAARDVFALFWETMDITSRESFILLLEVRLESFLFCLPCTVVFIVIFLVVYIF